MSTNNEGTPTPLTDAQVIDVTECHDVGLRYVVNPDFCRKLEERLAATKQRLEVAEKALEICKWFLDAFCQSNPNLVNEFKLTGRRVLNECVLAALHPGADKAESNEGDSTNDDFRDFAHDEGAK